MILKRRFMMLERIKLKKSVVFFYLCLPLCITNAWSDGDSAVKTVSDLVEKAQKIADEGNDLSSFGMLIDTYMDFKQISSRVLAGVKKEIRIQNGGNAADANKQISDFLPGFVEVFQPYIIKKYASSENLEKFKSMTPKIDERAVPQGELFIVRSTFKSSRGSLGDIKVNWHVNTGNKIVDIVFEDAGASPLRIEASQATDTFKKNGNNLDKLLSFYQNQ
jgi:ABC-type transporter MlaC component